MVRCHRGDPNLDDCMRNAIERLRPKLASGIHEMLIPPCEPLSIPEVSIKQNAGAVHMDSEYSNIVVSGMSNFTLRDIHIDTKTYKCRIDLWFPTLSITADYSIHGKLMLIPMEGSGPCTGNFCKFSVSLFTSFARR